MLQRKAWSIIITTASWALFVVGSNGFADALAGGPLACHKGGVIKLTATGSLSKPTGDLLSKPTGGWYNPAVIILGGPGAVSNAMAGSVSACGFERSSR